MLDEVGGEGGQAIGLSFAVPELEPNVPIIRPPALLKRRPECIHASLRLRVSLDIRQEQAQSGALGQAAALRQRPAQERDCRRERLRVCRES